MWVSKTSELIGSSPESFEAAARAVIARANRTLRGIKEVQVLEKRLRTGPDGVPSEYRVRLALHFDVASGSDELHW